MMSSPKVRRLQGALRNGIPRLPHLLAAGLLVQAWLPGADLARRNGLAHPLTDPVDIEIQVVENEVHVRPAQKNAGIWWLCGGMVGYTVASEINQARRLKAEQLEHELMDLVNELDCGNALVQRFEGGLNPEVIPVIGEVRCSKARPGAEAPINPVGRSPELLTVQYSCGLDDSLTALRVTMKAVLWNQAVPLPIDSMVEDQVRELTKYYQVFTYEISLAQPPATEDQMRLASAWLTLGADNLRSRILSGMSLLADALACNLGGPDPRNLARGPLAADSSRITEYGDRRWGRSEKGEITILERI